jgi:hypothetical protein
MQNVGRRTSGSPLSKKSLETVDAVARAAHLWIRSLCLSESLEAGERQSIAGGLVAGLCERLELDSRVRDLVAYVYALLDDHGAQALPISRLMLENPVPRRQRSAYDRGRLEAAAIVEMLAYHGDAGHRIASRQ